MIHRFILLLLLFGLAAIGCEEQTEPEQFEPRIVLNAFLTLGDTLHAELTRTQSLLTTYDSSAAAIRDALVIGFIDGTPDTFRYVVDTVVTRRLENGDTIRGQLIVPHYKSRIHRVESNRFYRIEARLPTGEIAYGETRAPSQFHLTRDSTTFSSGDTVTFAAGYGARMYLRWVPDPLVSQYWVKSVCEDTTKPKLREVEGIFNQRDPDRVAWWTQENADIYVPWFFFNYVGWHTVTVYNINNEFKRYLWTLNRSIDRIDQLEMNVQGGLGMVTAFGVDSVRVYVQR